MRFEKVVDQLLLGGVALTLLGGGYLFVKQLKGTVTPIWLYGLLGLVAVGLWLARRLPAERKGNILVAGIATLFTLYSVEAFLYFFGNPIDYRSPQYIAARQEGVSFDKRTPLQLVSDLRKDGEPVQPFVSPSNFLGFMPTIDGQETFALTSIANVRTVYCNESGEYILYDSDRYGLHNPDSVWESEQAEIVAVGDSFAQGACVASDKNGVALLRAKYPDSINLAASGSGPLTELAALKEYGAHYQPKVVLWFYFEANDLGDLLKERDNPILLRYLEDESFSQNLMARQASVDTHRADYVETLLAGVAETRRQEGFAMLRFYNLRRLLGWTREDTGEESAGIHPPIAIASINHQVESDPLYDEAAPLLKEILLEAQKSVHSWGGELYFVYLPDYQRYAVPGEDEILYRGITLQKLSETTIPLIDLHPVFAKHSNPLSLFPFQLEGHYTEEGYALVAETILQALSTR